MDLIQLLPQSCAQDQFWYREPSRLNALMYPASTKLFALSHHSSPPAPGIEPGTFGSKVRPLARSAALHALYIRFCLEKTWYPKRTFRIPWAKRRIKQNIHRTMISPNIISKPAYMSGERVERGRAVKRSDFESKGPRFKPGCLRY